jgi:hypothetical protein
MSQAKLNSWEAQNIARKIAEKAFEHVIGPINEKINEHLREAYRVQMIALGTSPELLAEVGLGELSDEITVSVVIGENRWNEIVKGNTGEFIRWSTYRADFYFKAESDTPAYATFCAERAPFRVQQNALQQELQTQLQGKSIKAVMKAWPEAARFVAGEFRIDISTPAEMTKPLETILAKYLPMLAAPQGV